MSDTLWHDRLAELAEESDPTSFLVDDDLARGRERLRRRRVGEAGAVVLVLAVLAGGALLSGGGAPRSEAPPAATIAPVPTTVPTVEPSDAESSAPPLPPVTKSATFPKRYAWIRAILERSDGPRAPFPRWRNRVFATTASVLDPSGGHLSYSNQGWTGGWDEQGISMGIKMGWSDPGRAGEGMVLVEISSQPGADDERCQLVGGFGCPQAVRVGGRTAHLGFYKSSYVVAFRQADGERVIVLIDKKFGNESPRGVDRLGFSRADVYRLVQDPTLDLPTR